MKRFNLFAGVFVAVFLSLAAMAMAQEASIYDNAQDWIVRAYAAANGGSYDVRIEVLDPATGAPVLPADIAVDGVTQQTNPITIAAGLTTAPDVSLAQKADCTTFVFYSTDPAAPEIWSAAITAAAPPTAPEIYVNPASLPFGNVNVGSTSNLPVTVSNIGNAVLSFTSISVTGPGFTKFGDTCGTSLAAGANCTITVRFAPTAATPYSGTLTIVSNDVSPPTVNVGLTGTGVSAPPTGNSDLTITLMYGQTSVHSGVPFGVTIYVKNQGTGASEPCVVRGYWSLDNSVSPSDQVLFNWSIPSLSAGQQIYSTQYGAGTGIVHQYYYVIGVVDADNQVGETNETNNSRSYGALVTR